MARRFCVWATAMRCAMMRRMRPFELLFDRAEPAPVEVAAYGSLGFPEPPEARPWIYANFVQTLDGVVSLRGEHSSSFDLCGIPEDRWLMDLLRAHADALMVGMGTLREERRWQRPRPRGPVFRIVDDKLRQLRQRLGRGPERNIVVSASADFELADYALFDGAAVEPILITSYRGAERVARQLADGRSHSPVQLVVVECDEDDEGRPTTLDLSMALAELRRRFDIRYLLCEGGPVLFSSLLEATLVDELFLTVSPLLAGRQLASELRPALVSDRAFSYDALARWQWLSCRRVEDVQFHRLRRRPAAR